MEKDEEGVGREERIAVGVGRMGRITGVVWVLPVMSLCEFDMKMRNWLS